MTTLERNLALALALVFHSASAAPFQNLGFEEVNTNSLGPDPLISLGLRGPISDLLPGWELSYGDEQLTTLGYNLPPYIIEPTDTIINVNANLGESIEGEYNLLFYRGPVDEHYYLKQIAEVPAWARELAFTYQGHPFAVSANGMDLSIPISSQLFSTDPRPTEADISAYAGQTVELTFRTSAPFPGFLDSGGLHEIDAIGFNVPEPSTVALWVLGASALVGRWVWSRKRPPS